jgi:hypothetical protein
MFVLNSEFIIGKYKFRGCNEVKITKSIHEYADTAVIKLPATSVLKTNNAFGQRLQTAKQFAVGDKVSIRLGYNGKLNPEFFGFVKRINFTTPCEIECEGYSYILRTKTNIKKSWKSTTLKEVLQEVVSGTDIKLHPQIPDMPLKNIVINSASGTQVIDYIKGLLKGALTAYFIGDTLYMGLTYMDLATTTVKHRIGWNTINSDKLKYRKADDVKVNIELQFRKGSGEQVTTSAGVKGGVTRRDTISTVTDAKHLNDIAKAKLLQECYDGYEGTITTFLIPYVQPGYRDELRDPRYNERSGNFFLESVETTYGMGGGRREVQIGIKLSNA